MKRLVITAVLLLGVCPGIGMGSVPGGATEGDLVLLDAPRGAWLANVRGDAALVVLEEREGWRRVRLEGWMAVGSLRAAVQPGVTGAEGGGPSPAPAPAPATVARAEPARAAIRGVLAPQEGQGRPGANVIVRLLADVGALDAEHARAGEACHAAVDPLNARIEQLRADSSKALNSSDNFRTAATASDALKKQTRAAEAERAAAIEDCRASAEAVFENHVAQRTIADGQGRFEFATVAPGAYRIVATEAAVGGSAPRTWSFDGRVEGSGAITLDPRASRSPVDPYWGLR